MTLNQSKVNEILISCTSWSPLPPSQAKGCIIIITVTATLAAAAAADDDICYDLWSMWGTISVILFEKIHCCSVMCPDFYKRLVFIQISFSTVLD